MQSQGYHRIVVEKTRVAIDLDGHFVMRVSNMIIVILSGGKSN